MYWFYCFMLYIPIQFFAYLLTPILPLFKVEAFGACDNNSYRQTQPRLPVWLSWFDTPDNSLFGDATFQLTHPDTYLSKVIWLYRNSLYGFKWGVIAATINSDRYFDGNPKINHKGPTYGTLRVSYGKYWQWKKVCPAFGPYCWVLNFGWLLDDINQQKALFMFSPRLKRIKYESTSRT